MRLRNVSGYPLQIPALGRDVAPDEVVDTDEMDGYDPDRDGPITGLAPVEDKPAKTTTSKTTGKAQNAGETDKETSK